MARLLNMLVDMMCPWASMVLRVDWGEKGPARALGSRSGWPSLAVGLTCRVGRRSRGLPRPEFGEGRGIAVGPSYDCWRREDRATEDVVEPFGDADITPGE
jgi:hypothetical protein